LEGGRVRSQPALKRRQTDQCGEERALADFCTWASVCFGLSPGASRWGGHNAAAVHSEALVSGVERPENRPQITVATRGTSRYVGADEQFHLLKSPAQLLLTSRSSLRPAPSGAG